MVDNSVRVLSLCAGYGGLDLGLRLAGLPSRTVCYVENEVAAARILAARFEDGTLDPAPVWSDLKTFDGKPWRGRVHCLTAGYPCQPFSCAGKQRAEKDPRHLWPQVARIVGEVQPEFVFLENVSNHLRLGFRSVVEDLGKLGYRVHAGIFSAEEVGAPHLRKRLFALAYREERGFGILRQPSWRDGFTDGCGAELADAESRRKERRTGRDAASRQSTVRRSAELEHANGEGWHDGRASGNGAGVGGGNEELRPALAQSGRELENTARAHVQPGRRRRGVSQAGDELADARHGLVSILRRQAQGRTGVRPAGEDVEHSAGAQRALRARGGAAR